MSLWHVEKFIKDDATRTALMNKVRDYAPELKDLYIALACRSDFPQVSMLDFTIWAKQTQCVDNKNATAQYMDIFFIAANHNSVEVQGFDPSYLMRYKFIEILVRVAQAKYADTIIKKNGVDGYAMAFEKLLTGVVLENAPEEPL